jgi:UTP-glucose-1-phosphate uridylyltransferase
MDKTRHRREMIKFMEKPKHKKIYRERSFKVEPMQGLVKDIFELNRCWMRGNGNNRWLFAAMGLTIQMHQLEAFKQGKSTWIIKERVLG